MFSVLYLTEHKAQLLHVPHVVFHSVEFQRALLNFSVPEEESYQQHLVFKSCFDNLPSVLAIVQIL